MGSDFSTLLGIYLSTDVASVIMNAYLCQKTHMKVKKESYRKLVYKDNLSFETKKHLRQINVEHFFDMMEELYNSLIPVKNVMYTYENLAYENDFYDITKEVYDEIVEESNEIEDDVRKNNADMLRSIRERLLVIPSDVDLDSDEARFNGKQTKRLLKINHLNFNTEMSKYKSEKNI